MAGVSSDPVPGLKKDIRQIFLSQVKKVLDSFINACYNSFRSRETVISGCSAVW